MDPDDTADTVAFDDDRGVYRASFEAGQDDLCFALVDAIATIRGIDPIEVTPLGEFVDIGALEQIVQSSNNTCEITTMLPVHGYRVLVNSEGVLELEPMT